MIRWLAFLAHLLLPSWRHFVGPDRHHAYGRTLTKQYVAKKSMVKNFWIAAALLMLVVPSLPVIIGLALFTTFVSFMYLDEA